ncbi:ribonuclease Z [Romboutsia sp. 1001216sp1]|uniref:ribonuclease Z n=1 Tax=Romboutsia sp. 1001216sp1 TaxID=2986997 RepID=UPI00232F4884|nr:ribonuclease Z [Romboutsia sp. 1001216sp1]MDB8804086.1 ribonuclease Z [Romboutsia sp. 1001216sp1]MDB8807264.1 ribonuclease Z [Romboutsia sp. 1001216sp1]MDB8809732.1 ribonuclease Z [Romboutsia sp. 1001216sp1]MDB8815482.1 ribonuclease Z [Romboutsia sp. 1001216sp1]MDB8818174.1 ribonuclease Z [Romboutsia sp. 1001216sp1]
MIDLILLGCGGNLPTPNRYLSSLFINYNGSKILIDCGEGTQISMKMKNCGFKNLDLILITHLHGDHFNGLPGLLSTIGNSGRTDDLTIVGPVGIKEYINAVMVLIEYIPYKLNIIENPKNTFSLDHDILKDIEISTMELDHSRECLGYSLYFKRRPKFNKEKAISNNVPIILWQKLQSGKNIVYNEVEYTPSMVLGDNRKGIKVSFITDTRPLLSIPKFIKDSNLFVCEGMYGDDMDISKAVKNHHMTFREAANLARLGNVDKLILTHFSPSLEDPYIYLNNATSIFKNTIIGEDRLSFNLNFKD